MSAFRVGERVVLIAVPEEGWREQRGYVWGVEEDYPGMLIVHVDAEYQDGPEDDGLREIHEDYVRREADL